MKTMAEYVAQLDSSKMRDWDKSFVLENITNDKAPSERQMNIINRLLKKSEYIKEVQEPTIDPEILADIEPKSKKFPKDIDKHYMRVMALAKSSYGMPKSEIFKNLKNCCEALEEYEIWLKNKDNSHEEQV